MSDAVRTYPHGVPCWIDLAQPDPGASAEFYGRLFGWEFADAMPPDAPGSYLIATLDGRDAAALTLGDGSRGWLSYVACDDADATAALITAAGGTVLDGPEDAGPGGRTATVTDPQGAVFRLWQPYRRVGAQAVNVPGAWNFSYLHTPDPEAALAFYREVFGWRVDAELGAGMIRLPGYGAHLAATVDPDIHERQRLAPEGFADVIAGLVPGEGPVHWSVAFTVVDRDAALRAVESLGGEVGGTSEAQWTRDAEIVDPQGARFTLTQVTPPR